VKSFIPAEFIEKKIYLIRGHKVMLDRDLAGLYGIGTRDLNKAVTRNLDRFPEDFMLKLNKDEFNSLMFQIGTSKRGGTRKMPRAFTEQGIAMLSSVLKSKKSVQINIMIMRAFVKLRQLISSHRELARRIEELEKRYSRHELEITTVFKLLKQIMAPPQDKPVKRIGFLNE
jgi:hypothetical protein